MKISFGWSLAIATAVSLLSFFLMFYSENLPYNLSSSPICDRTKYPCELQVIETGPFGESYQHCGNSVCDYPKVYDPRPYGFYGAMVLAFISYGYIIFTLAKKRSDERFRKAYWLLIPAIPIAWFEIVTLYFSIYPS